MTFSKVPEKQRTHLLFPRLSQSTSDSEALLLRKIRAGYIVFRSGNLKSGLPFYSCIIIAARLGHHIIGVLVLVI